MLQIAQGINAVGANGDARAQVHHHGAVGVFVAHQVGASAAIQGVIALAAFERVTAVAAFNAVVATAAHQGVVEGGGLNAFNADQGVVPA